MKFLVFLILLFPGILNAQQGLSGDYLKLQPASLPSICSQGTLRFDISAHTLNFCGTSNNWSSVGSVSWGSITGTLSSQTDLNTALGLKAPLASPTFTGTLTIPTSAGILKSSSGGVVSVATSGSDYSAGTSSLSTGILKSTNSTGALSIAIASDFPTLNQNTTGSAATLTTARTIAGTSFDGSANISLANKLLVQGTSDSGLSAAQFMGSLGTGIVKNTTSTGVQSIAIASDFPTLNQNTTGSAATLTTPRTIAGTSFSGSANISLSNQFLVQGTSDAGLSGAQFMGSLGTGIVKNTTTTGVQSIATSTDIIGLFSTCSGSQYLGADGACHSAAGAGTVTNVAMTVPAFLSIAGSPISTSGTLAIGLSGTALPIANGGTGRSTIQSAPSGNVWAAWDGNVNFNSNAFIPKFTSTVTAAQTVTMVVGSTQTQVATGSSTITYKLPTTSIVAGEEFLFLNQSTGVATIQSSAANTIVAMAGSTQARCEALVATPTTAANWSCTYQPISQPSTGLVVAAHVAAWTGGTPSGEWGSSTGTTLGAFNSNANAPVNTLDFTTTAFGSPQTANSLLPQITVNSLVPGTYKVTAQLMTDYTVNADTITYAINDGTTSYGMQTMITGATEPSITIIGVFNYTTTANKTFAMWGQAASGEPQIFMQPTTGRTPQLTWLIEKMN